MQTISKLFVVLLILTSSESLLAGERLRWLTGDDQKNFALIEKQFSGTYISMVRVGYRYNELFFAGQDENWEFARYQVRNIRIELQNAFIRRPRRTETSGPFMDVFLPKMEKAIKKADKQVFLSSFDELTRACNGCHMAQQVPYINIQQPTQRLSPVVYVE